MILSKRLLFFISLLFVSAPLWKAEELSLFGHGLFIRTDAFVSFGLSLLFALIIQAWLPSDILTKLEKVLKWAKSKINVLTVLLLVLILAGLILINKLILHSFLSSADEHSCYFLAECLRIKKLWVASPPLSEFFNVVHVGNRDGKWFSVYPPGWPLIWAAGISLNIADYLNPFMAVLSLLFFYLAAEKVFEKSAAAIGIIFASFAPFFMFTSASYFSHTTCLLMISIFLYGYVNYSSARSEKKRFAWAILIATSIGYGLITRYLTMTAVSAPVLVYELWQRLKSKTWRKTDTLIVIILGIFVAFILYQNWLVTGNLLKPPNKYDKSWERLGFRKNYTPLDGLIMIISRFFYLTDWFSPILLFLFFLALFSKRSSNFIQCLFRWGFFYSVIAYFFYYSWGGGQYGPRYYYEGFLFMGSTLGDGIVHWWKTGNVVLKKFIVGAILASLISNAYLFYKQSEFFQEVSFQRKSLYELAEKTIKREAIVFIQGHLGKRLIMTQEDTVRNHPLLNTKILYAHDLGDKNKELMQVYPNREYYMGFYDSEASLPVLQKLSSKL